MKNLDLSKYSEDNLIELKMYLANFPLNGNELIEDLIYAIYIERTKIDKSEGGVK